VGVLSGSVLTAVLTGRFKLEGYTSPSHMVRSISGAALMGIGGAMAYGCSIGQGLTGLSTLGMPSFIAVAGIVSGAALGIRGAVVIP
ncbi:YeeE/YedE thiosulfate transporter family protein, partial [Acinetobacter baumannii]